MFVRASQGQGCLSTLSLRLMESRGLSLVWQPLEPLLSYI